MKSRLFIGASLLLLAGSASAAVTDTSTAAVTIENQAITLTNNTGLNFGTVLPFGRNGTVSVNVNGQASANNAFLSDVSEVTASTWSVSGVPGAPYSIALPTSPQTVSNGSFEMTVTNFVRTGGISNLALDAGGIGAFAVGATLNVGANQPTGSYTGEFDVTVVYN